MQRKRAGLVPIGEVVSGLDDVLVPAIRDDSPQARRGFTVADQVNQLVAASEADPDLGFMARLLALCSLPRTNPVNRHQYKRVNGHCHVNRVGPQRPAWIPFQAAALALSHRLNGSFRNRLNVSLLHK